MTTIDISDKGLLFRQAESAGLESGRKVLVELYHADKTITFSGIIRMRYDDNTRYGLQITHITSDNQNKLYHLIYNGRNTLLPREQDSWMTIYDALLFNVGYHLKNSWRNIQSYRRMKEK